MTPPTPAQIAVATSLVARIYQQFGPGKDEAVTLLAQALADQAAALPIRDPYLLAALTEARAEIARLSAQENTR